MLIPTDFSLLTVDRWKAPAPVVTSKVTLGTPAGNQFVQLDFSAPGILNLPPDGDRFAIYFEAQADAQRRIDSELAMPLEVAASGSFAYAGRWPRLFTFYGDADQQEFAEGYGTRHLDVLAPFKSGGQELFTMRVFQAFTWYDVDLAEALFLLTRFYSGGGANALVELDETTFESYSKFVSDPRYRARMFFSRRSETSLADHARELVDNSSALLTYGRHSGAAGLSFKLRIFDRSQIVENSAVYGTNPGRDSFIVTRPALRFADDLVTNQSRFGFGDGVQLLGVNNEDSYSAASQSPIKAPQKESTITQEDAASISSLGVRGHDLRAHRLCRTMNDAEGGFEILYWSKVGREITFNMGPLHFDFDVGDLIHVDDPELGISPNLDFLVLEKTFNWDLLTATVRAVEFDRTIKYSISPDLVTRNVELVGWFKGDAGITVSTGDDISSWANQAPGSPAPDLVYSGLGLPAQRRINYRNALTGVSFEKQAGIARALDWSWSSGEESWTMFFVLTPADPDGTEKRILSSAGGASGPLEILASTPVSNRVGFNSASPSSPVEAMPADGIPQLLIFQLFRTRGNYALAGDERCFVGQYSIDAVESDPIVYDDPQSARAGENALSGSFGDDATTLGADVKLRQLGPTTVFGAATDHVSLGGDFVAGEILIYRHKKGAPEMRRREFAGVIEYLRSRWA